MKNEIEYYDIWGCSLYLKPESPVFITGSAKSTYVRGWPTVEFLGCCSNYIRATINVRKENEHKMQYKVSQNWPGSLLSANDQFDKGPVMLRTVTQTSSTELKDQPSETKQTLISKELTRLIHLDGTMDRFCSC